MSSGETLRASSTHRDVVDREMTSFLDTALKTFWAMPRLTPPAEVTMKSLSAAASLAGAQILSNGLFFETLSSNIEAASLKQSKPIGDYTRLLDVMVTVDPLTSGQLRIPIGQQIKILRTARTVQPGYVGNPLNALGMPYGSFLAPWYPAWAQSKDPNTGVTYVTLRDVEKRWEKLSEKQAALADYADRQDLDQRLRILLGFSNELADTLINHGNALVTLAEDSSTAHGKVATSLTTTVSDLTTNLTNFQSTFGAAVGCPGCPWEGPNGIAAKVQDTAQIIKNKCAEKNAPNPWTVMDMVTKYVPIVGTAASVVGGVAGQIADASKEKGFLYYLQYIQKGSDATGDYWKPMVQNFKLDKVAEISSTVKGIADGISKAANAAKEVAKKIDPINNGCPVTDGSHGAAQALLSGLVSAQATLDVMAIQARTLEGMLSSIAATGENYFGERQASLELVKEMEAFKADTSFSAEEIRASLTTRARFIEAACKTLRSGVELGSKDLYAVSAMLQTSAGRSSTQPQLVIPGQDLTWNVGGTDQWYPYITNVWNSAGFSSAFDSKGDDNVTSYVEAAQARFSSMLLNNICRFDRSKDPRPPTGFTVRRVIAGEELDEFFAQGYVNFGVGLRELLAGGADSIDREVVGVAALRGATSWDVALAAPVVLGARYSTCNGATGAGNDPCCRSCKTSINLGDANVSLLRYGDALVPSTCDSGEIPAQMLLEAKGTSHPTWNYTRVIRTCLHPVITPAVNGAVGWMNTTLSSPYSSEQWKSGTDDACATYSGTTLLVGLRGTPLLGNWTLADGSLVGALTNRWSLGSNQPIGTVPIVRPAGITALEVLYFVAAEPKPLFSPANYLTLEPIAVMNGG